MISALIRTSRSVSSLCTDSDNCECCDNVMLGSIRSVNQICFQEFPFSFSDPRFSFQELKPSTIFFMNMKAGDRGLFDCILSTTERCSQASDEHDIEFNFANRSYPYCRELQRPPCEVHVLLVDACERTQYRHVLTSGKMQFVEVKSLADPIRYFALPVVLS